MSAFSILKKKLVSTSSVVAPDWELSFELMCDASDYVVGVGSKEKQSISCQLLCE